ncbi:MAG: NAD(P)H-hydrate dehydratase, partial [Alphaproteobacteria bacterium]
IVAIDIVSGFCADSGRRIGKAAPCFAHLTVTFHRAKLGHYLGECIDASWALRCVAIGLGDTDGALHLTSAPGSRLAKRAGHKFGYGHALILCGPPGHGGAARMAARGALRIGAGLVTLACPPEARLENVVQLDAIMLKIVGDGAGLADVLSDTRLNALCLGPGLGLDARAADSVRVALEKSRSRLKLGAGQSLRLVLDADALTLISRDTHLFALLHKDCVLTPHGGEFARLFPDIAAKLDAPATKGPAYSKVDATRDAAARADCVVLYKGPDTVIASPDGTCAINNAAYDRAAPWLATAGSGDVLAGFITGLLARGFAPHQAAETGAWLHVECARSFGPGLIAEDLSEELPKVFRALGL